MRQITIRDEDFVGGVCQLPEPLDELHVKVLIANTDNIDKSTTPDNVVLLKLPEIGANGERGIRVTVELLTDLSATLRIVGDTPSQGVGHAIVKKNVETTTRGDTITLVANRERAWEIVAFGNAQEGDGSFGGTFNNVSVDHAHVYLNDVRIDDGSDDPYRTIIDSPIQLEIRTYDGDGNQLNGVPALFKITDDPAQIGVRTSSDGLVTPAEPTTFGYGGVVFAGDPADDSRVETYVFPLTGLAQSVKDLIALLRANGARVRLYDGVTLLGDSGAYTLRAYDDESPSLALLTRGDYDTGADFSHIAVQFNGVACTAGSVDRVRLTDGSEAFDQDFAVEITAPGTPIQVITYLNDVAGVATINKATGA